MRYQVRFVSDHALPGDVPWAFAKRTEETYLFVKRSAIDVTTGRCDALSQAWEVWQATEANRSQRGRSGMSIVATG